MFRDNESLWIAENIITFADGRRYWQKFSPVKKLPS
jgi:hypothetical protein